MLIDDEEEDMTNNRRTPLNDNEIERIAKALLQKSLEQTRGSYYMDEKKHYDQHARLDRMLNAYESATNIFSRTFFGLVIVGMIFLAGLMVVKGVK